MNTLVVQEVSEFVVDGDVNGSRHPLLRRFMDAGVVWIEGTDYVGQGRVKTPIAPDGIVGLGGVGYEDEVEAFLSRHPDPFDW